MDLTTFDHHNLTETFDHLDNSPLEFDRGRSNVQKIIRALRARGPASAQPQGEELSARSVPKSGRKRSLQLRDCEH